MTASARVYVDDGWRYGMPMAVDRDPYWVFLFDMVRRVSDQTGKHCITCGGYLWSLAGTGILYCDETCRNRQARRRQRYRDHLRDVGEACQLCGCDPDSGSAVVADS